MHCYLLNNNKLYYLSIFIQQADIYIFMYTTALSTGKAYASTIACTKSSILFTDKYSKINDHK